MDEQTGTSTDRRPRTAAIRSAIRVMLDEAIARARPNASTPDRMVATLLAGLAVESAFRVILGEDAQGGFKALANRVERDTKRTISKRREGDAAWRARIALQHAGLVPDLATTESIVLGALEFCDEVIAIALGAGVRDVRLSDDLRLVGLRAPLRDAEDALSDGQPKDAAVALSRAHYRLQTQFPPLYDALSRSKDLAWDVTRAMDVLLGNEPGYAKLLRDWVEAQEADIMATRRAEVTGIGLLEHQALLHMLPACDANVVGVETVYIPAGYEVPGEPELRWAFGVLFAAALRVENLEPPFLNDFEKRMRDEVGIEIVDDRSAEDA